MKRYALVLLLPAFIAVSCKTKKKAESSGQNSQNGKQSTEQRDKIIQEADDFLNDKTFPVKNGIQLSYFPSSVDFPDAELEQQKPGGGDQPAGRVFFQYKIKNFELTKVTDGAATCGCANSDKGQHIHQIINNEPYIARYTDTFSQVMKPGHFVNLCFLSRSFHESVKGKKAYQLTQFNVGDTKGGDVDLKKPMLFYSRPKGEYKGKETQTILLDFYLTNTDLSEDGNKVRATINGNEFMLTSWRGYAIQGLPMGVNTIKLELLDKDGNLIPGPYNTVERKITLKPE